VSYSGYKAIRGIAQLKPNTPTQGINTLDQGTQAGPAVDTPSQSHNRCFLWGEVLIRPSAARPSVCVGVVSQVWGAGTRLGIYRMSPQRAYWYVTYNSGPTIAPTEKQGDHLLQRYVPPRLVLSACALVVVMRPSWAC
jgi:hypothetical protein